MSVNSIPIMDSKSTLINIVIDKQYCNTLKILNKTGYRKICNIPRLFHLLNSLCLIVKSLDHSGELSILTTLVRFSAV